MDGEQEEHGNKCEQCIFNGLVLKENSMIAPNVLGRQRVN